MKLLSTQQIQEWDAYTIHNEPISSIDLMERAAKACVSYIITEATVNSNIKIFCGKGNNGGDGLAIARQLIKKGFRVTPYIIELGSLGTTAFQTNLQRLHVVCKDIHFIQSDLNFPIINKTDIVVDALMGSGLSRPITGLYLSLIEHINAAVCNVISIDLPTGLLIDQCSTANTIIKASTTLTFQSLKLCFLAAENAPFFGRIKLLDIQLKPSFLTGLDTNYSMVEEGQIKAILQRRLPFSHKGNFGHALLIAGGIGKMGAAILSAKACLRPGVGLLTAAIPKNTEQILHIALPELMVQASDAITLDYTPYAAIGIGPGIGTDETMQENLQQLLKQYQKPIVLDADAINIIALNPSWVANIPAGSVLTPHPKEFDRLFGKSKNEFDRWQKALDLSVQYNCVILVKGHYTLTANNGKGWFNNTGNVGLAKGGSGDILTGIITALLAQGYSSENAAILGVYLHGLAADFSLDKQSVESLLASDTIDSIGKAFNYLHT
jgi:NAD(P)H-hydrate epimerase